LEPGPLESLLPNWRSDYPGMRVPALRDEFAFMTQRSALRFPLVPRQMHNHGNFIISLGQLTPWLAQQAEVLGVDVFAGFAAAAPIFDDSGRVKGVRVGDMGLQKDGTHGPNYTPGAEIHAGVTLLAEGSRGSIAADLRPRVQRTVAPAGRARTTGVDSTFCRLAGRSQNLRRQFPLPLGRRSGVRGLRRRP